jgi:monomeric isocitrate dehydrogenase
LQAWLCSSPEEHKITLKKKIKKKIFKVLGSAVNPFYEKEIQIVELKKQ